MEVEGHDLCALRPHEAARVSLPDERGNAYVSRQARVGHPSVAEWTVWRRREGGDRHMSGQVDNGTCEGATGCVSICRFAYCAPGTARALSSTSTSTYSRNDFESSSRPR